MFNKIKITVTENENETVGDQKFYLFWYMQYKPGSCGD